MKLIFVIIAMFSLSIGCSDTMAQETYIKNNIFHTTLKDGMGIEVPVDFTINEERLRSNPVFLKWKNDIFKDIDYAERNKNKDALVLFLTNRVYRTAIEGIELFKNPKSVKYITNASFSITTLPVAVFIKIPVMATNGVGIAVESGIKSSVTAKEILVSVN